MCSNKTTRAKISRLLIVLEDQRDRREHPLGRRVLRPQGRQEHVRWAAERREVDRALVHLLVAVKSIAGSNTRE